eukprot:3195505-Prorocentrum_lima.AAC.1
MPPPAPPRTRRRLRWCPPPFCAVSAETGSPPCSPTAASAAGRSAKALEWSTCLLYTSPSPRDS